MNVPRLVEAGLLVLALQPAAAHARTGEAEVRIGPHGGPCFTIAAHEERVVNQDAPAFQSITVADGHRPAWKMTVPAQRAFTLGYAMCVPYGGRVASLPQAPAAELVPGKVYHVRIDARPAKGTRAAASYEARFCLVRQPDGSAAVHRMRAGEHEGRHPDACAAPD